MTRRGTYFTEEGLKKFEDIKGLFGVQRREVDLTEVFDRIIDEETKSRFSGVKIGEYWVQQLRPHERTFPPNRFTNALDLHQGRIERGYHLVVPEPVGLVYPGNVTEFIATTIEGYYVTRFVEGKQLTDVLKEGDEARKEEATKAVLWRINGLYRSGKRVLLDFAPRDILMTGERENQPVFCDTEHSRVQVIQKGVLAELEQQFRKDYENFLQQKTIDKLAKRYLKEK